MRDTLRQFTNADLFIASLNLLDKLGLKYFKGAENSISANDLFKGFQLPKDALEALNLVSEIYFVAQIDERTFKNNSEHVALEAALLDAEDDKYKGIFIFAINIPADIKTTRSLMSSLTRAFNQRAVDKPVVLFIKQDNKLSLSICERTKYKLKGKPGEKLGRVSLLKDINCLETHEGHIRIIQELDCSGITSFGKLYEKWQKVFNTIVLTKQFYDDLFEWFQWAIDPETKVSFPGDVNIQDDDRKNIEERIIRLITRLMFVWFIKQKGLVPNSIFDANYVKTILKNFEPESKTQCNYYQAILQNLFFGTLNRPIIDEGELRGFAKSSSKDSVNLYRYSELFSISEQEVIELFSKVPFLNCGLFDCLDKTKTLDGVKRRFYNDGFSRNDRRFKDGTYMYRAVVPNILFFHPKKGILSIFNKYVFTIEENTPQDVQVALDPELLGKVFENLLGYINPETHDTARNESGSFYTPREIVQYMVNESLAEHLKQTVGPNLEKEYRQLLDYSSEEIKLTTEQRSAILHALFTCKVLDPACGSGAFPMGMLQQMVHILQQVDPDNSQWRDVLLNMAVDESRRAFGIVDEEERKKKLLDIEETFNNGLNSPDYTRKLYIIESCIYGVDKMPIAMLITRLRFFITLICEQTEIDWSKPEQNFGIKTLPNLESKFVAANSLVYADIHKYNEDWTQDEVLGLLKDELMAIRRRHFYTSRRNEKIKLLRQDEEKCLQIRQHINRLVVEPNEKKIAVLKQQISDNENLLQRYQGEDWVEESIQTELFKDPEIRRYDRNKRERDRINSLINTCKRDIERELSKSTPQGFEAAVLKVTDWNPYDQNAVSPFLDIEWMFGVSDGYDIVISNPPYQRIQGIRKADNNFADYLSDTYKAATGSFDLCMCFVERSLKFINQKGLVNFIMPVKWTNAAAGKGLRKLTSEGHTVNRIINFGAYQVFNASTYTGLQWFIPNSQSLSYNELDHDLPTNQELKAYLDALTPDDFALIKHERLTEETWVLTSSKIGKLLDKLDQQPRRLENVFEKIFQGLATSRDDVYYLQNCTYDNGIVRGHSDEINRDVEIEEGLVRPLLKGDDVHRYDIISTNRVVIFPYKVENDRASLYSEQEIATLFPRGYEYLKECENILRNRERGRLRNDDYWFRYIYPKNLTLFDKEKLVAPEISLGGNYSYDENGRFYSTTKIYGYIKKSGVKASYKSLMAILNSKVMWFFMSNTGYVLRGGYYTFKTNYVGPFPLPSDNALLSVEANLETLVDKVTKYKAEGNEIEMLKCENQIDEIVYDLYNLEKEERAVIGLADFRNASNSESDE